MTYLKKLILLINQQRYLTPILAFVIYGTWACYANLEHGFSKWFTAGLAQGSYAFGSTLIIGESAKKLYYKFKGGFKAMVLSFICTFFVMLMIPLSIHRIIKTPDILESILPGLVWGSFYILCLLSQLKNKQTIKT